MDFGLDPEQRLLQATARELLAETVPMREVRAVVEHATGLARSAWDRMAGLGWHGLAFPEEHGGAGLGLVELGLLLEEMGRALVPGPFLATVLAGRAILHGGDARQQARWLPGIASGACVATLAVIEDDARWDASGVAAVARPERGALHLAGRKLFVPEAADADVVVAAVRRADDGELALVVIERDAAPLVAELLAGVDRTRRIYALALDDVEVPAANVLAAGADAVLARVLDEARVALAAEMGGGAARVLEMTVEHARTRQQFDRPIGSFQAVQHACADMLVGVECARIAALGAAWAADQAAPEAALEAAVAKATASDAYRAVTAKAIQLHGGIGFTWEHDCHLYYRRAIASAAAFGDATFCRELVAQQLAL